MYASLRFSNLYIFYFLFLTLRFWIRPSDLCTTLQLMWLKWNNQSIFIPVSRKVHRKTQHISKTRQNRQGNGKENIYLYPHFTAWARESQVKPRTFRLMLGTSCFQVIIIHPQDIDMQTISEKYRYWIKSWVYQIKGLLKILSRGCHWSLPQSNIGILRVYSLEDHWVLQGGEGWAGSRLWLTAAGLLDPMLISHSTHATH